MPADEKHFRRKNLRIFREIKKPARGGLGEISNLRFEI
jgi:hypothetical protein